ncbi:MAG TPA: 4,5-DOPA dioxygenase extradiol [Candidatus Udaeobacter sp.]|nr:4,5-DOPA dioxygenase extradiol [Candidatus Udaeobacter sp.]
MAMRNHTPPVKVPVLFVGHGSPMNAIESNAFTRALEKLGQNLPRPGAICVVSAHWVTRGSQALAAEWPRTIHDFYGFPKPLYEVQYPAPGAPEEAKRLAFEHHLVPDQKWGLDHGAWSVLRHMYPNADVPVFQVSLDQTRTFAEHLALGRELQKMRERGILILGSGNLVHNLHKMNWELPHEAYPWATEFDQNVKHAIEQRDTEKLAAPDQWGPNLLAEAHATLEHYAPILYCISTSDTQDQVTYPYEGIEFGSVSMRTVLFQPNPSSHS